MYELKNQKIFITGGTGFFGKWLVESLLYFNHRLNLNIEIGLLTRNINRFIQNNKELAQNKYIRFYEGDIISFNYPCDDYSYFIHAASRDKFNGEDSIKRFLILSEGTKRLLEYAIGCNVKKLLLISSGGVYGKESNKLNQIREDSCCSPDTTDPDSCYGEGKRVAELLCSMYAQKFNFEIKIARCFSFIGPYFPLDIHFAIGNFINDAINGRNIIIRGDGSPVRSYMYASDLMIWLWTILFKGNTGVVYNVGSDEAFTLKEIAKLIASKFEGIHVDILNEINNDDNTNRYIPSIDLAKNQLGLEININLDEAIQKTINFQRFYSR
jgi:dTDP-glucose 4,6-dehydratase